MHQFTALDKALLPYFLFVLFLSCGWIFQAFIERILAPKKLESDRLFVELDSLLEESNTET